MSERMRSVLVGALMILLLVNLITPLAFHFMRPAPVEAQSSKATYSEDWTATQLIVSQATINYWSSWCGWCWHWRYQWGAYANSVYVQTNRGSINGIVSGRSYAYSSYQASLSPHGLVTEWRVTGSLKK